MPIRSLSHRVVRALAVAGVLIGTGLLVFQRIVAPRIVRRGVLALVAGNCPSCRVDIGKVTVGLLPWFVQIEDVGFAGGDPQFTTVTARARMVRSEISPRALFKKKLHLGPVIVDSPEVLVEEGDGKRPDEPPTSAPSPEPEGNAQVDGIEVHRGSFTYLRAHGDHRAELHLHEIESQIDAFGSTDPLRERLARATSRGRLEESGRFLLSVETLLFSPQTHVDVDLRIDSQNLADVNAFFKPGEGVTLSGTLEHGLGTVNVRGNQAEGWVYAQYRGLKFELEKTEERSAFSAFFTNLFSSLVTQSENDGRRISERSQGVVIARNPEETLLSFLFRALREAALRIPKK